MPSDVPAYFYGDLMFLLFFVGLWWGFLCGFLEIILGSVDLDFFCSMRTAFPDLLVLKLKN